MLRGYWLSVCAAVGLALAATAAMSAQAPRSQGVATPRPAVAGQSANSANAQPQPTVDAPLPVQIIQSSSDAEHAQEREAKSDNHDAEDLDAQIRAADAAEKQIPPAWVAAILTFFGTALLVWNLTEARKANRIAIAAIEQSERHARQGLRAYIGITSVQRNSVHAAPLNFYFLIKNAGQTPAYDVTVRSGQILLATEPKPDVIQLEPAPSYQVTLAPGEDTEHYIFGEDISPVIGEPEIEALNAGKVSLYIEGIISYRDAFREQRYTKFKFCYGKNEIADGQVSFCADGNDST